MRRLLAGCAIGLCVAGATVACSGDSAWAPDQPQAVPTTVRPGESIVISSSGFACDESFDDGKTYDAQIVFVGRQDPIDLGEVAVAPDGTFTATFQVPTGSSPGEAAIGFSPIPVECPDDASCAGYSAYFSIG